MAYFTDPSAFERLDARDLPCEQRFKRIMGAWHALRPGQAFVLVNNIDPLPLYYQLNTQFGGDLEWRYLQRGPEVFEILVGRLPDEQEAPATEAEVLAPVFKGAGDADVDARGLEPPEPMLRILSAAANLTPGASLQALTDRKPVHLLQEIESRGYRCESSERADGSWTNRITRL
jgi:uncharacterized protein (DUF2249 family)